MVRITRTSGGRVLRSHGPAPYTCLEPRRRRRTIVRRVPAPAAAAPAAAARATTTTDSLFETTLEKVRELSRVHLDSVSPLFEDEDRPWGERMAHANDWLKMIKVACDKHSHFLAHKQEVESLLASYVPEAPALAEDQGLAPDEVVPIILLSFDFPKQVFNTKANASFYETSSWYCRLRGLGESPDKFRFLVQFHGKVYNVDKRSLIGFFPRKVGSGEIRISVIAKHGPAVTPPPYVLFSSQTLLTTRGNLDWEQEWMWLVSRVKLDVLKHFRAT